MKSFSKITWCIGIDEVGRGPIAGPVTIGVFAIQKKMMQEKKAQQILREVRDSKQLTESQRESIFRRIAVLNRNRTDMMYRTISIPAPDIDRRGIAACIHSAIARGLSQLRLDPQQCHVFLDGGLKAPDDFTSQETVIKGDQSNSLISAASIIAKVTRDRYMVRMDIVFPGYGFAQHKGYGTKQHYKALTKKGLCQLHRKTWVKEM